MVHNGYLHIVLIDIQDDKQVIDRLAGTALLEAHAIDIDIGYRLLVHLKDAL